MGLCQQEDHRRGHGEVGRRGRSWERLGEGPDRCESEPSEGEREAGLGLRKAAHSTESWSPVRCQSPMSPWKACFWGPAMLSHWLRETPGRRDPDANTGLKFRVHSPDPGPVVLPELDVRMAHSHNSRSEDGCRKNTGQGRGKPSLVGGELQFRVRPSGRLSEKGACGQGLEGGGS